MAQLQSVTIEKYGLGNPYNQKVVLSYSVKEGETHESVMLQLISEGIIRDQIIGSKGVMEYMKLTKETVLPPLLATPIKKKGEAKK